MNHPSETLKRALRDTSAVVRESLRRDALTTTNGTIATVGGVEMGHGVK